MQCFGTKNVNRENSGIPPANRGCLAARRQHVFASASALRSLQSRSPAIETGRGNAVGGTPAAPLSPPLRSARSPSSTDTFIHGGDGHCPFGGPPYPLPLAARRQGKAVKEQAAEQGIAGAAGMAARGGAGGSQRSRV